MAVRFGGGDGSRPGSGTAPRVELPPEAPLLTARDLLWALGMDEMDAVARMELQPGWDVYDTDGQHVGTVEEVGRESFTVRSSGPIDMMIGVDFTVIESADDGRVDLQVTAEELTPTTGGPA